jgi:hypothetical protein
MTPLDSLGTAGVFYSIFNYLCLDYDGEMMCFSSTSYYFYSVNQMVCAAISVLATLI